MSVSSSSDSVDSPTPSATRDVEVADLCNALNRACGAMRLYSSDHPIATKSIDLLHRTAHALLAECQEIVLDVQESSINIEGIPVFSGDQLRDKLAFLMFRDGVRALRLRSGLQRDETVALIQVLAHADALDRAEQDLVTVLWEQDFAHIDYHVLDPLLEGEETESTTVDDLKHKIGDILEQSETLDLVEGLPAELEPDVSEQDGRLVIGSLTLTHELEQLEQARQIEPDVFDEFLVVLCEVLVDPSSSTQGSAVPRAISDVLASYFDRGEFGTLTSAINRLRELGDLVPNKAPEIETIIQSLASLERLRKAVVALDGAFVDRRADLEAVLLQLGESAQAPLVELLVEADGINARRALLNTLTTGSVPTQQIVAHLGDPRWYVARNMVCLLGALRDDTAIPALERTIGHPDERVRREAVRTLGNLTAVRAAQLVELALSDPASSVRVLAARAIVRQQGSTAAAVLLRHVAAKDFAARPESEVRAFFEALGDVADDSAVSSLDVLWKSRLLLRGRPMHVRVGALGALGRIATPRARQSLERASRASDSELRSQAKKSLAEADRKVATP